MSKITIYSTATCVYCKMLKDYLTKHKIKYTEKHVDQDQKLVQELMDKSGQLGVPFTIIENDDETSSTILGFDKSKIDQILGLA